MLRARWQTWYSEFPPAPNIRFVTVRAPRSRWLRIPWQAIVLPFTLRRHRPDVVHLPNTILMWPNGFKVVMTIHDVAEFQFPEKFDRVRAFARRGLAWAAGRAVDRIVAVSQYTKETAVRSLRIDPGQQLWLNPHLANPSTSEAVVPDIRANFYAVNKRSVKHLVEGIASGAVKG